MHRIIKSHLDSFCINQGIQNDDESVKFEKFANYAILSGKASTAFDLDDVTTGNGDSGVDGIAIVINEEIVNSNEDAKSVFSSAKKNNAVEIIFIQSKSGESFDLGEFLKFKEAVLRLSESEEFQPMDEVEIEAKEILNTVFKNVPKIRGGKPDIVARFVATGLYTNPKELERAKNDACIELSRTSLFGEIDIKFIDRDELTKLWIRTYSGTSANIEMFSLAALPTIDGIAEAYIGVVKAKEIVNKLLESEDGGIRSQVFEENVRAFLGSENGVNSSIAQTLSRKTGANRFPVLNNGITIVSPDVRVQGNIIHLENFQIVNGCQTSHVLFENRKELSDEIMVNIKVVETINEDIFAELVRATNSQTKVEENQFYSLRPVIKRVEKYFDSYDEQDGRLYFERRDKQFVGRDIPAIRIFNLQNLGKSVCSMYLQRPELAFRYAKRMFSDYGDSIFGENIKEIVYYSACLTLYRIHLLVSNGRIPTNIKKYKWHLLPIIRAIIADEKIHYNLSANKTEKQAEKIVKAMSKDGKECTEIIKQAVEIIHGIDNLSNDRLKRQAVIIEALEKI
ncbi:MAG: AIPR family protein [Fibrobacterota bacterium]|nr:AIPR family protein [Fibrobacterota bacterium]QQS07711.1 MAG: AIPR family protein [Fibrobacterota bacterium]